MKKMIIAAVIAVVALSACEGDDKPIIGKRPSGSVSLASYDAELIQSNVFVYQTNDKLKKIGDPIYSGTTDDLGRIREIDINVPAGYLLFEVGGKGHYFEEASGKKVLLNPDDYLKSIWYYEPGDALNVTVSGFTSIGATYAQCLVDRYGQNPANAMSDMTGTLSAMYNIPLFVEVPQNPSIQRSSGLHLSPAVTYGLLAAGVSQLMADIALDNGLEVHSDNYRSFDYYRFAMRDIAEDSSCALDGSIRKNGVKLDLGVGNYLFSTHTYRVDHARAILSFIKSDRNLTAVTAGDFLYTATALADVEDVRLFAGVDSKPLDDEGPVVHLQYPEGHFFAGLMEYRVKATDYTEVHKVEMYVNDLLIGTEFGTDVTFRPINTATYADGQYTIKIVAEDTFFQKTEVLHEVNFYNASPLVSLTSDPRTRNFEYEMSLQLVSPIGLASVKINGADRPFNQDNTVTAAMYLDPGVNSVTVEATDILNNKTTQIVELYVDRVAPKVTVGMPNGTYVVRYSGSSNIGHTYEAPLQLDGNSIDPIYLDDSIVALNGIQPKGDNLRNGKFSYVEVYVTDDLGSQDLRVITPAKDIVVTYEYFQDGALKVAETLLSPFSPLLNNKYYLPLTEEFLGSEWYLMGHDKEHKVTIHLVDLAGNRSSYDYEFKTRYFVDPSPIAADVMTTRYAGRSLANFPTEGSQEKFVEYTYKNLNTFPVTLGVKELASTAVLHTINGGRRENIIEKTETVHVEGQCQGGFGNLPNGTWQPTDSILYHRPSSGYIPGLAAKSTTSNLAHSSDSLPSIAVSHRGFWVGRDKPTKAYVNYSNISSPILQPKSGLLWGYILHNQNGRCALSFQNWKGANIWQNPPELINNDSNIRYVTTTSYLQVAGYPRNVVASYSEASSASGYSVSAMIDSVPQADNLPEYRLEPGQVIKLTVALHFPKVNLKGNDCSWDYTAKKCDSSVELNTKIGNVLTLKPVFSVGNPVGSDLVHEDDDLITLLN